MEFFMLNPGITIFGFTIYYYALIIVTGMIIAMFLMKYLMKRKGLNPDDMYTYAIFVLPIGILSARFYFFLFPYEGMQSDWSRFWNFRDGGLAIYGGIIGGTLTVFITSLIKKQNFFDILDCITPGVFIAQAMGRWGNFLNQEAFGNLVTNPKLQWFPYAVFIENQNAWYQATFFYESFWNVIGFVFILLWLLKWKNNRRGIATSFYFLWYGIGRLWIEGLRSDSLYLKIFGYQTGIKVSQFISVIGIIIGLVGFIIIYWKEINRLFKGERPIFEAQNNEVVNDNIISEATDISDESNLQKEANTTEDKENSENINADGENINQK